MVRSKEYEELLIMAAKERSLKLQARKAATDRGHKMPAAFKTLDQHLYRAVCQCCKRSVDVNIKPQPNQVEISGDAVAIDCKSISDEAYDLRTLINMSIDQIITDFNIDSNNATIRTIERAALNLESLILRIKD